MKKKFRVCWTEDHCAVVEAEDADDAHNQVHNEDNHWKPGETFVDQQTVDISEVEVTESTMRTITENHLAAAERRKEISNG